MPGELITTYKCRRCSETHAESGGGNAVVLRALISMTVHPAEIYYPAGSGLGVGMIEIHLCKDGGIGISDLQGASSDGGLRRVD